MRVIIEQDFLCNLCKLKTWLDKPITLELEHKDGDRNNNIRENLECLCPNCHSYTPTWRGRNINRKKITDDEMIAAIETTSSLRQALISLGMSDKGGNYIRAKRLSEKNGGF